MNSIYGQIGVVAHHFGWTYDYILHEVDWRIVKRIMIDLPSYDYGDNKKGETVTKADNKEIRKIPMTAESWEDWAEKLEK